MFGSSQYGTTIDEPTIKTLLQKVSFVSRKVKPKNTQLYKTNSEKKIGGTCIKGPRKDIFESIRNILMVCVEDYYSNSLFT